MSRRFNWTTRKKVWKERTFEEKLLFWKTFYVSYHELIPAGDPRYEYAEYEEVLITGGTEPFVIFGPRDFLE